jgi:peptide/nickel transport system permease protein
MWQFVARRLGTAAGVLLGVSVITHLMVHLTPGDPAVTILRQQSGEYPSEEALRAFREEQGLNDPIPVQYADWMWDVLHGNLGQSYYHDTEVTAMILHDLPYTVNLALASLAVALVIAVPAGVISAVHKGRLPDFLSQGGALVGVSMPNFWLGYLLLIVFALGTPFRFLGVFPVTGTGTLRHIVLPAVTLGSGMAAIIMRLLRSAMLDVLEQDYIRTARSKGLVERIVVYKHAFRNALVPVVTIVGLQFGYMLNGAVIVEIVFSRPGIGRLLIDSIFARDYPVVQGLVLIIAVVFVLTNFLVDVTYRYIDPRISFEGETHARPSA